MSIDLHAVGRWLAANYEGDLWCAGMAGFVSGPAPEKPGYLPRTLPPMGFRVDAEGGWWVTGRVAGTIRIPHGEGLGDAYPDLSDRATVGALFLRALMSHGDMWERGWGGLDEVRARLPGPGGAFTDVPECGLIAARALVPEDTPAPWEVTP